MNKIKILLSLSCTILTLVLNSQHFQWSEKKQYANLTGGTFIVNDKLKNAYVIGNYKPAGNPSLGNPRGSFLHKYDQNGNLLWFKDLANTSGARLTVDNSNSPLILTIESNGYNLTKFDSSGNVLKKILLVAPVNGQLVNNILAIGMDGLDNYYVAGTVAQTFSLGNTPVITTNGQPLFFLAKLDNLDNCAWAVTSQAGNSDENLSIKVDVFGNCSVGGTYYSTLAINGKSVTTTGAGTNGYVARFDNAGVCQFLFNIGSTTNSISEYVTDIAVDLSDNIYAMGMFSTSLLLCGNTLTSTGMSDANIFFAKIDKNGSGIWAKQFGGLGMDFPGGIAAPPANANIFSGNVYVSGNFVSSCTVDTIALNSSATSECFIAKFNPSGNVEWCKKAGANTSGNISCLDISLDVDENLYFTGNFSGSIDFGTHTQNATSSNMFIVKLSKTLSVGTLEIEAQNLVVVVYPNPSSKFVTVNLSSLKEKVQLQIFDGMGILHDTIEILNTNSIRLDFSHYQTGVYLLNFSSGLNQINKKVTLQ